MIGLLLACRPDAVPPSTEMPVPSPESRVVVRTQPGLRDLVAVADFEPTGHTWWVEGVESDLTGPVVPADRLYPGETWTVEATDEVGATHQASHTVAEPRGGNVLVLLIDDVGVDKVGAYGWDTAGSTPNLDALAADGVRFTRAYASPVCSPTRGTLITSRMPRRTGLGWVADTGS